MKYYSKYFPIVLLLVFSSALYSQGTKKYSYFSTINFSTLKGIGKYNTWWDKKYYNNESIINLSIVNGMVANKSRFGFGLGFEVWQYEYGGYSKAVPLFFHYDYTFAKAKQQIFSFVDVGYTFGDKRSDGQEFKFDKLLGLGPGIKFRIGKSAHLAASIYYKLQQIRNGKHNDNNYHRRNYSFIGIRLGIQF